jgi:hypothetical protein
VSTADWVADAGGRFVVAALCGFGLVAALSHAGLHTDDVGPLSVGDAVFVLIFVLVMWPFYVLALWRLREARRFRLWALLLTPLLGLPLNVGLLTITAPATQAMWLTFLGFALTVHRPPRGAHAEAARGPSSA